MELAHQSHAKSQIMAQLRKKIKEATAELASLEEREVEIEEKGNILNDLRDKLEDQKFGAVTCTFSSKFKLYF